MPEVALAVVLLLGDLLYPTLEPGQRLGRLRLGKGTVDARGTEVPAGDYSLRYVRQPPLKDHVDTAEHPDFAVLLPLSAEREHWELPALVAAAARAGGGHPLVLELRPPGTPGTVRVGPAAVRVPEARPPRPPGRPAAPGAPSGEGDTMLYH